MIDMINTRAKLFLAALLSVCAVVTVTGCAAKKETTLKPPPPDANPEPQLATDIHERVKELTARAKEYSDGCNKLPGRNAQDDRAQTTQQFALLAQILPILNGPDMSGDFRQQLRIIESTRAQLASGTQDLSIEPTVDTGLRAAHRALAGINQRAFTADNPDIARSLDVMSAKVQELDGTADAIHRLIASQAFKNSAQTITQMSTALSGRLGQEQPK
jgi:hypothetical protein